jgi:MarR family 2-MHQ and catechol resistance regulon transcriptional repressor
MTPSGFLPTLRELTRCYQAFEGYSMLHLRSLGLTSGQFDVIATLGNTPGMSCKALGERTLITKGTLTGLLDRMTEKGWLQRQASSEDRRSLHVSLTAAGQALFEQIFPEHLAHLQTAFAQVPMEELEATRVFLSRLRHAFEVQP